MKGQKESGGDENRKDQHSEDNRQEVEVKETSLTQFINQERSGDLLANLSLQCLSNSIILILLKFSPEIPFGRNSNRV